jgi:predicted dehydrogenase
MVGSTSTQIMKRSQFIQQSTATVASMLLGKKLAAFTNQSPLKIAVVGFVHTHVHWLLGREKKGDVEIVAIVEPNSELAARYCTLHGLSTALVYHSLEAMYAKVKPDAATAFGTIFSHLAVVEFCAPRGIHVMVEKPLAVSMEHALAMQQLANKHKIVLLTNYETSWYSSNALASKYLLQEKKAGAIRKIVFHTGHPGPIEIGCNKEFTDWLTDPIQNGAGALTDFGCYGANLATWLLQGEKPVSVSCSTQQYKPHLYPNVDDDCTIILNYAATQVIIQASWNWPFNVKDMEVYGTQGYVMCKDGNTLYKRFKDDTAATPETASALLPPYNDPFAYFAAVVKNQISPAAYDVSSLPNNMMVMQILDAAKKSAASGMAIRL